MKISIIIAAYNAELYISRAIRSCLEQSMEKKDYEIIVVDDGSTDNTQRVLSSFGDWIKVINLEKNMGMPYACNIGIRNSLSRFVVRVDSDDYIHEDMLKVEYLYLSLNNEIDSVACDYYMVDENENTIKRMSAKEAPIACGILFRKDKLISIGLYDEKFLLWEDEDLRIRYLKKFSIHNIPLPLYRYRMHQNNNTKNMNKAEKYRKLLNKKHKIEELGT